MRWLGPVFVAVILPLLLSEFTDWCPWFARRLVRRAVRRLPEGNRARWEEEWLGDLASFEGRRLSILIRGFWIYFRAPSWGRMLRGLPPIPQVFIERIRALVQRPKKEQQELGSVVWGFPGGGKTEAWRRYGRLLTASGTTVTVEEHGGDRNVVIIDTADGEEHRFEATDRELSRFMDWVHDPLAEEIELESD